MLAVVVVQKTHVSRFVAYTSEHCKEITVSRDSVRPNAVWARSAEGREGHDSRSALSALVSAEFVTRVVAQTVIVDSRQYFQLPLDTTVPLDGRMMLDSLQTAYPAIACHTLKLVVWPRQHLFRIGSALAACSIHLNPKLYSHVLSIVCDGWQCHFEVTPRNTCEGDACAVPCDVSAADPGSDSEDDDSEDAASIACRARHKLNEVFARFPSMLPSGLCSDVACSVTNDGIVAVDLGAAPGGWTQILAAHCRTVYAVDPGDLHSSVSALRNVVHCRRRLILSSEATETGVGASSSGASADRPHCTVDYLHPAFSDRRRFVSVLTCDAIIEAETATSLLLEFQPWLLPGALLVFTLKNRSRSQELVDASVAAAIARLSACFDNLTSVWLFSNKRERTIMGRCKGAAVS